ncbi:putative c-14 sterol reductase [Phaeomoniella chlamydospora]|uniref:Delta(14)-sterol reductase n=1 Tax=Phaeomoniella chlamydospora TaxID=158046 RepID=A0A0G2DSG8_PHACM|nr:putative c-14 sterol reductase [Phaeomoniella chlamydospora]
MVVENGNVKEAKPKKRESKAYPAVFEKHGYEFGGPLGAFGVTFGLPILVYLSTFLCNDVSGCPVPSLLNPSTITFEKLKRETPWPEEGFAGLFDFKVSAWVLAYFGLLLVLQLILPGVEVEGVKLACGGKHKYKFNTFTTSLLVLSSIGIGTAIQGTQFPLWPFIWDNLIQIITACNLISFGLAFWVYVRSFSVPHNGPNPTNRELAPGGQSGNILYDFFIGRELNPRVDIPRSIPVIGGQTIDVKIWCELRPGMLGYIILNLAFCVRQYSTYGHVSDSLILITLFQALYVLDAMFMEPAILTTIDVIMDGFGFMLAFGDLVWLPFIYSLQARYLAVYPVDLGPIGIAGILAVQGLGYFIFRSANNEKNRFRTNPNDPKVAHLKYIETRTGSRLITSGWWGRARHINYLGDWIMSWSYSLPTGIAGYLIHQTINPSTGEVSRVVEQGPARGWGMIATYFYILYFAVLLIHREGRDEEKCKKKYGKDWDRYTSIVRSRIVPGIY